MYRKPPIFFLNTELTLRLLYTYITNFIVHVIWSSIYKSNLCSFEGLNFGRRNALGKHTHFLQQSLSIGDFFLCNNFILFLCIIYRRRKCCYDSCTALSDHGCGWVHHRGVVDGGPYNDNENGRPSPPVYRTYTSSQLSSRKSFFHISICTWKDMIFPKIKNLINLSSFRVRERLTVTHAGWEREFSRFLKSDTRCVLTQLDFRHSLRQHDGPAQHSIFIWRGPSSFFFLFLLWCFLQKSTKWLSRVNIFGHNESTVMRTKK